jgi:hypothetical protein
MSRFGEYRSRFGSEAIVGAAKSAASWALGPLTRARTDADLDVAAALRALEPDAPEERWKELTEELLHLMYVPVTGALARAFVRERDAINQDSATLVALAKDLLGPDIDVTADDLALPQVAVDHATWLPVARTSVLVLLDWLVAESDYESNVTRSLPATDWVLRAMKSDAFESDRFRRATALDESAAASALDAAAAAIVSWEPIVVGVPLRYLGRHVFLRAQPDGTIDCERDNAITRLQPVAALKMHEAHQVECSARYYMMTISDALRIEPTTGRITLANDGKDITVVPESRIDYALAAHASRHFRIDGEWYQEPDDDAIIVRPTTGRTLCVRVPIDHAFTTENGDLLMKPQA